MLEVLSERVRLLEYDIILCIVDRFVHYVDNLC